MSFCNKPTVPAKIAVKPPTTTVKFKITIDKLYHRLNLNNKKTPAVTIVAAWINAETGVGPYIASGNHICKPICADFPTEATNNIKFDKTIKPLFCIHETCADTTLKSKLFAFKKTNPAPKIIQTSPIRLTITAFNAALLACKRVNQKLTSKYEHNPTPSHPINSIIKLLDDTNINIKNVNKDK